MTTDGIDVARAFVRREYPACTAAFLAGSASRGEATAGSDLDILVVDETAQSSRSVVHEGLWPIELLVFTSEALRKTLDMETKSRMRLPFHIAMLADSIVLHDADGTATELQDHARALRATGPVPATDSEIEDVRYMLTCALDDFVSARNRAERTFEAMYVAQLTARLSLLMRRAWTGGQGRWLLRSVNDVDPELGQALSAALASAPDEMAALTEVAKGVLAHAGGPLFEGYRRVIRA
jgi:predicted nucleotidyltransferase